MANGQEPGNNPLTTVWETTDNTLTRKETHEKPVTKGTTWNIKEQQAKIDKYMANAQIWIDKCEGPQAVIDKHTEEQNKP